MFLVTARTIEQYAKLHPDARSALGRWCDLVRAAAWRSADEVCRTFPFQPRALPNGRLVFKINGNEFRIVCSVQYADPSRELNGIVRVQFIGSHAEYDQIDAETVTFKP